MTDEITPEAFPKYQPNPLFANLPAYLKDPKNFKKIQKALLEKLASAHSHGDVLEYAGCAACQKRFYEHGEMVRQLGFTSQAQYRAWLKVHETIKERVKLR